MSFLPLDCEIQEDDVNLGDEIGAVENGILTWGRVHHTDPVRIRSSANVWTVGEYEWLLCDADEMNPIRLPPTWKTWSMRRSWSDFASGKPIFLLRRTDITSPISSSSSLGQIVETMTDPNVSRIIGDLPNFPRPPSPHPSSPTASLPPEMPSSKRPLVLQMNRPSHTLSKWFLYAGLLAGFIALVWRFRT
jgi:hypothetical protein